MLAPLLQWRPVAGADPGSVAILTLGRGQLLGLTGTEWRDAFAAFKATAREAKIDFGLFDHFELQAGPSATAAIAEIASCAKPLCLVAVAGAPTDELLAPLLEAAEMLARRGGGVILGADELPATSRQMLSRTLDFPLAPAAGERLPALRDDQGLGVNFLRQGEWGEFFFPLPVTGWADLREVRLRVTGPQVDWLSPPADLDLWRRFISRPTGCSISLAMPWRSNDYTAALQIEAAARGAPSVLPLAFTLRQADTLPPGFAAPDADEPALHWRFLSLPAYARQTTARTLRLPPRSHLGLSGDDQDYLPYGWHQAESAGADQYRRWTQGEAVAVLGGLGRSLHLLLHDHRPRLPGQEKTTLTLELDGQVRHTFNWDKGGDYRYEIPWINDGLSHEVRMKVEPVWSPADQGSGDKRELGVLVDELRINHG